MINNAQTDGRQQIDAIQDVPAGLSGRPTTTADLPRLLVACPARSSLQQIEFGLEGLHAVAVDLGLEGLAGKIETAKKQAHHEVKVRIP